MGSEDDRAKLNAMNELERELILTERADARDAARERHRAELALRQAQGQQQRAAEMVIQHRIHIRLIVGHPVFTCPGPPYKGIYGHTHH